LAVSASFGAAEGNEPELGVIGPFPFDAELYPDRMDFGGLKVLTPADLRARYEEWEAQALEAERAADEVERETEAAAPTDTER
jgi:hypothetical protein